MEIHFALAHFPIALLVTGGAWLLAVLVTDHKGTGRTIALGILAAGAAVSIPTVGAGLWIAAEHETHHLGALETHRLVGIATMVVAVLGLCSHWLRMRIPNADVARNLFFLTSAVLAGVAGMLGGEIAHGGHPAATAEHAHGSDAHSGRATRPGAPDSEMHPSEIRNTHQVAAAQTPPNSANPKATEQEAAANDREDANPHEQGHEHDHDHKR